MHPLSVERRPIKRVAPNKRVSSISGNIWATKNGEDGRNDSGRAVGSLGGYRGARSGAAARAGLEGVPGVGKINEHCGTVNSVETGPRRREGYTHADGKSVTIRCKRWVYGLVLKGNK